MTDWGCIAMADLRSILSPLDLDQFLVDHWGSRWLYLKGAPERYSDILDLESFERTLEAFRGFLAYPRVTMYSDGHILHDSRFTIGDRVRISGALGYQEEQLVDLEKVQILLAKGATLKISQADKVVPQLAELLDAVSAGLEERVHANLYYSSSGTSAFAPHFDKHDVFILQVFGRKRWQVFDCREPHPLPGRRKSRGTAYQSAAVEEFDLSSGDLLYLPRGQWHHAATVEVASLHITVGVECATSVEFLRWLAERLEDEEEFRMNLPRGGGLPAELQLRMVNVLRAHLSSAEQLSLFRSDRRARRLRSEAGRVLPAP